VSLLELNLELQIALLVGEVRKIKAKVFGRRMTGDLGRPRRREHHVEF
jgi:hypothetical protein